MGYTESLNVMDLSLSRVPEPESTDGEVLRFFIPEIPFPALKWYAKLGSTGLHPGHAEFPRY